MNLPTSETLERLDWSYIRDAYAAHCQTYFGSQLATAGSWWGDPISIEERYQLLSELQSIRDSGGALPIGAVVSAPEAMSKISDHMILDLDELRDIRDMLLGIRFLRDALLPQINGHPRLRDNVQSWPFPEMLCQKLEYAFTMDGQLSENEYPRLAIYRLRIQDQKRHLESELQRLLTDPSVSKMLQESFVTQRNGRYVLPLKANFKRKFGIVHGRSQSGETFFVEPLSVLPIANSITENELALEQAIQQICTDLSRSIFEAATKIMRVLSSVALLDTAVAAIKLGEIWGGVIPHVGTEGTIALQECRHPVLLLQGNDVVPNDFQLSSEKPSILLSGPNAGGKTIALKQLGLMGLLVRSGLPVPAQEGARCDFFEQFMVDIGDTQTLEDGLSTFSAKIQSLNQIISKADDQTLVMLDELGMGTDPAQGAALAQAVIEALIDVGARVVVTTHFTRLKAHADVDPRFQNAAAQFHDGRPTYALQWGMMGQSYALDVAFKMGFPKHVLNRAESLLGAEEQSVASLTAELAERLAELELVQAELSDAREVLAEKAVALEIEKKAVAEQRRNIRAAVHREFQDTLWQAYVDLKADISKLKETGDIQALRKSVQEINVLQAQVQEPQEEETPQGDAPQHLVVGQRVFVPSMRSEGTVLRISKNSVMVQVNQMKMKLSKSQLRVRSTVRRPRERRERQTSSSQVPIPPLSLTTPRSEDNTCDLRGLRVDDAIVKMELFFAQLIGTGAHVAFLLHGHGTGRLKAGLRSYLPSCTMVIDWQPGQYSEGGDAFTRVELG